MKLLAIPDPIQQDKETNGSIIMTNLHIVPTLIIQLNICNSHQFNI